VTEGSKRLWAAVLEQAIEDVRREHGHADRARAWFQSEGEEVGSFLWICRMLDIDPKSTRKSVVKRHAGVLVRRLEAHSSLKGLGRKIVR